MNYLLTALHTMWKQKLHVLLNLLGLGIGISSSLLMMLYVLDESSFDQFHPNTEYSYRLVAKFPETDLGKEGSAAVPGVFKKWLPEHFGDSIVATTQIGKADPFFSLYKNNERLSHIAINWADSDISRVFALNVKYGDISKAMSAPAQLAISESVAQGLFGTSNAVGQTIKLNNALPLSIQAVFADPPKNTHLRLEALVSMPTLMQVYPERFESWNNIFFYSYLNVKPGSDIAAMQSEINKVWNERNKYYPVEAVLQPMTDIHLTSNLANEFKPNGNGNLVTLATFLALLVLAVACFNFINLSTAKASLRAMEVGIRKALGAERSDIILQFLLEALVFSLLGGALALLMCWGLLPSFNEFTGKSLTLMTLTTIWPQMVIALLLVALLSGSYPAFFISAYNTQRVLSGDLDRGRSSVIFRKLLVITQSTLAIALLIMSTVVYQQIKYNESLPMGYDKSLVVLLTIPQINMVEDKYDALYTRLKSNPNIISVTTGDVVPTQTFNKIAPTVEGDFAGTLSQLPFIGVNYDYLQTFDIKLLAGRDFRRDFSGDWYVYDESKESHSSPGIIINRAALQAAGWSTPESAIGKRWSWDGINGRVIGVIDDVNYQSNKDTTNAFFMVLGLSENTGTLAVKIRNRDVSDSRQFIDEQFAQFYPVGFVDSRFLSEDFAQLYAQEQTQITLLLSFTGLILFITCLGLAGLAVFTAQRRNRELAIRKVLGAEVYQLVWLLTREFSILVLIANLIAWPIAYWLMSRWLESFVERISLNLSVFIAAGLITLLLSWLTVSAISLRASSVRPSQALQDK